MAQLAIASLLVGSPGYLYPRTQEVYQETGGAVRVPGIGGAARPQTKEHPGSKQDTSHRENKPEKSWQQKMLCEVPGIARGRLK